MEDKIKKLDSLVKENKLEEALVLINSLINENGEAKDYLMKRSVILFRLGRKTEALSDVKKALQLDKNDPNILKALVDLNASIGNYIDSHKYLSILKKERPMDKGLYDREKKISEIETLSKSGDRYNILIDSIRQHVKDNRIITAKEIFIQIRDYRDENAYELGCLIYRKLAQPFKVIEIGEKAIKDKKHNDKIIRLLALSYGDLQNFKKGEELLEKHIKEHTPGVKLDLSYIKLNLGKYEESLKLIDELISLNPREAMLYLRKGDLIARIEGVESAIKYYKKAIEINPLYKEAYDRLDDAIHIQLRNAISNESNIFR